MSTEGWVYPGTPLGPPFPTDVEGLLWAKNHPELTGSTTLLCRRDKKWRLLTTTTSSGLHLHLINDPTGTENALANAAFTPSGEVVIEGDLGVFDLGLPDIHQTNERAEILIDYGPHFIF